MEWTLRFGFLTRRISAFIVDRTLLSLVTVLGGKMGAAVAVMLLHTQQPSVQVIEAGMREGLILGKAFWAVSFWFLNYGILQGMSGSSVGKWLFRLQVVGERKRSISIPQSLLRTLAYFLSAAPAMLGFLAVLWDRDRRTWHDLICKTKVVDLQRNTKHQTVTLLLPQKEAFKKAA